MKAFTFAHTPILHFGVEKIFILPSIVKQFGRKALLITGVKSFDSNPGCQQVMEQMSKQGLVTERYSIIKEPSPAMIDKAVQKFSSFAPDVVVAIGGGSVLDAGKAISAMLLLQEPVKDYLEGVGIKPAHPGVKIPFIAIPTTAGTGSEATKNAVLSEAGVTGYKKSLRHNNFVPDLAIVDPSLTLNCPESVTAASGMDAFTQLLESYLSTTANPITDALAFEGLTHIAASLLKVYKGGSDLQARTGMAMASYLSGVSLANAGLGLVHGFASSVGGYFEIPHGVVCSTLMWPANKVTVRKLRASGSEDALVKYAQVGKLFASKKDRSDDYYVDLLLSTIEFMKSEMKIPGLSNYGITSQNYARIVEITDNKNNPIVVEKEEMIEIMELAHA